MIKSNGGQLMLVSPQQAVTRPNTTSNIISRPAVPTNTHTVKICAMPVVYLKVFSSLVLQLLSLYKYVCNLPVKIIEGVVQLLQLSYFV